MTRRLLDYGDDLNDVLRSALDAEKSASGTDPDAARLAKIGAGIAARIGAPPPPQPPPTNPPPGHAAPVASVTSGGIAAKAPFVLLAAAVLAGLVAIGSMSNDKVTSPPSAPVAKTVETAPIPVAEPAPSEPGISLNDLPSVAPTAKAVARPTPANEAPTQEEISLIGHAHDALRSDPAAALALCKQHETKFAGGHFAQEREAVAIEALVYLNRKDEAKKRFAEFDTKYPSSSHRVHLETLLAR